MSDVSLNPYGYGVVVAGRYYVPVLEDNQPYPSREKSVKIPVFTSSNSTCIRLARKTCVADPQNIRSSKVEYVELGEVNFTTPWRSGLDEVEVSMRCTENRRLIVRVSDPKTGVSTTSENLDGITGTMVELQEMPADAEAIKALMAQPREPKRPEDLTDADLDAMSDDELAALIAAEKAREEAAKAKRVIEADQQGRFFEALGLESDASVDDIRTRQVELAFRMRSNPDAVAAVNHAAEMAVEECNWRIDTPAVLQRVKAWRPAWDVLAGDITQFLHETVKYDVLMSNVVESAKESHPTDDPSSAVFMLAVRELESIALELKKSMAEWYCARAANERKHLIDQYNEVASKTPLETGAAARSTLSSLREGVLVWVSNALKLDPSGTEIAEFQQRVLKDIAELEDVPDFSEEHLSPVQSAPALHTINSIGTTLYGHSSYDASTDSYLATRYFVFFAIPLFPLGRYRVSYRPPNSYRFLGRVPLRKGDKWHIAITILVIVGLFVLLSLSNRSGGDSSASSYSSPSYPTSTSSPADVPYGGTPRNSSGYGQGSNTYRPTNAGVSALESEIDQARARLRRLESNLQQQQTTLESYKASIDMYGARIKRIERASSSGETVDQNEYESALRQHNNYVELYNVQLSTYQSDHADYEALLSRTNLKIDEYNRRIGGH
jgi:hypothetical protein